jgi:YfiH family protein
MEPIIENSLIRYPILSGYPGLVHFTTTQQTFTDPAPRLTGEDLEKAERNQAQLAKVTCIDVNRFVFPRQTHSDNIQIIDSSEQRYIADTDALIIRQKGICICIQTADCVPILIFDHVKNVIAVVHAGWRGTVNRIVQKTIGTMENELGCNPAGMVAAIGPSISPGVYEVGEDVYSQVIGKLPECEKILENKGNGKMLLNLWEANRLLLLDVGINPEKISVAGLCTYSLPELFFSARYSGQSCGRIVSAMMLT